MTISIELPPEEERTLLERARMSGRDLAAYVRGILQLHIDQGETKVEINPVASEPELTIEDLIDHEAIAYCEKEADDSITLEEVRAATSKIKDSMARVVIKEERAERF